jgi:4-hydroxythreonine-4-phosphate dehydrogenase
MARPLLLTPGEPAGIGPELACRLALEDPGLLLVADPTLLSRSAEALGLALEIDRMDPEEAGERPPVVGRLRCWPVAMRYPATPGRLDPGNAPYVLECLERAAEACLSGRAAGLVTGPIHKGVINDAGVPFSGHTEFLAERAGVARVVMLLTAGSLRVALVTTHLPLRDVAEAVTTERVRAVLEILNRDLIDRFGLERPHIAVLGLNPHAGEAGHLGREEIDVIEPVLEQARADGMSLSGPLPADTAFLPSQLEGFDAVLAMYHDQGLPVLKHAGFGQAVNVTLGLPFIRTSVDHGTALDLAGQGKADPGSLRAAVDLAQELIERAS